MAFEGASDPGFLSTPLIRTQNALWLLLCEQAVRLQKGEGHPGREVHRLAYRKDPEETLF